MSSDSRLERRIALLRECGSTSADVDQLLSYTAPLPVVPTPAVPFPDAPHVAAWAAYADDARQRGVVTALAEHFPQFRFPIQDGISETEAYRAATRRGDFTAADEMAALAFASPASIALDVVPSAAGRVPILVAGLRADFETLVRALTERNEPAPVPASLGACLLRGLNNWSRVAAYRRAWHEANPDAEADGWPIAFKAFAADKSRYQDTVVILSTGRYSDLPAEAAGLPDATWLDRSLIIRREHELAHYLTACVYGSIRRHFLDEVLADFAGLRAAFGRYDWRSR